MTQGDIEMTDLLTKPKPDDTGEIPRPVGEKTLRLVGEGTQNLAPYVNGLPPALRRPTVTLPIYVPIGGCRTVVPNDEDFVRPGQPAAPAPEPTPEPKPTVDDRALSDGEDVIWSYAPAPRHIGRHRRPSRWDWLTVPLAMAVQRIGRAL
jgi:hypothetical protein